MMTLENFKYGDRRAREWAEAHREEWMSDNQWLCYLFLHRLFKGFHHIPTAPKAHGSGIEINFRPGYFATYDFDYLTKLVIMAHNWGVRCDIAGSGPGMIKLVLHKRRLREGRMNERHPTIAEAIEKYKDF